MKHRISHDIELAWSGKLPAMGDFVGSSERTELRCALDGWLESGTNQLCLSQGDPWRVAFDQAPMWNFLTPLKACNASWLAGCVSPSCDRVGRRFPLVVAYGFPAVVAPDAVPRLMEAVPGLLSGTGSVLFQAIRRGWTRDTLAVALTSCFENWHDETGVLDLQTETLRVPSSVIMDILSGPEVDEDRRSTTQPLSRTHSFPWTGMTKLFDPLSETSFWWTNSAGGAPLKAFVYDSPITGLPMSWLFGTRLG